MARKIVTGITKSVHTALELRRTYKQVKQFQGSKGRLCNNHLRRKKEEKEREKLRKP
jgi:hypothetical protein